MAEIDIPITAFATLPVTPGEPTAQIINVNPLPPGLVAPDLTPITTAITGIRQVIASDKLANTPGSTPAPPPDNFRFTDFTVNVSGSVPGDVFKGTTPDVKFQFLDLTPDALGITALGPNVFIKTDSGNDVLIANGGRNILSAGSGLNTLIGAPGKDTFVADATTADTLTSVLNFQSGDDVVITGINPAAFTFTVKDALGGLVIDANPINGSPSTIVAELILGGYKTTDFGSKLSFGVSSTTDGVNFLFVHAT